MKANNLTKFGLAIVLSISTLSCSTDISTTNKLPTTLDSVSKSQKLSYLKINLAQILKANKNNSFSVKRYQFDDSENDEIRVYVYGVNIDGNKYIETEKTIKSSDNLDELILSVTEGNKVISIETYDDKDFNLTRLMSAVNIKPGVNSTLKINYGTYPSAMVLKYLMDSADLSTRNLANTVNLVSLEDYMKTLTGYDLATNTYSGVNPAYVDTDSIAQYIISNTGTVPTYTRGVFDTEIKAKLRVKVINTDGDILDNADITINDLTSEEIDSSNNDITVIDNVSYGTWILRAKVSDGGDDKYAQRTINVKTTGDADQTITLTVEETTVDSIKFEDYDGDEVIGVPTNIELLNDDSAKLEATVTMTDGTTNTDVDWSSNDENIATVSNGTIKAVNPGTTTIRAAATDDTSKYVIVNVTVIDEGTGTDAPSIDSFSPMAASTGTLVTIKGKNFDEESLSSTTVKFSGVTATVTDVTETEIKAIVPSGAVTGKITITTSEGTDVTDDFFVVKDGTNTTGMVFIPGDDFKMGRGSDDEKDYYPEHKVTLNAFYIDRTEVTNAQFKAFIDDGGYSNSSLWTSEGWAWKVDNSVTQPEYWNDTRFNGNLKPVVGVSWYEAYAYAKWMGRRLPTEAEWEYASKGDSTNEYPWGSGSPSGSNDKANGFFGSLGKDDGFQYTSEVGEFADGNSPFGLKDMSGNAYEWTNDWYNSKYYVNSPLNNPTGPGIGGTKVLRGGSWYNHPFFQNDSGDLLDSMKTYFRFYSSPANRSNYIGFRTAK